MTYQEAEHIIAEFLPSLRNDSYFKLNNTNCLFLAFIIAPDGSETNFKRWLYEECITNHKNNKEILVDMNLIGNKMQLFFVYQQGGEKIIIPFESYLSQLDNAS